MSRDREAVGFVAHALHEEQRWTVAVEHDRFRHARLEQLLVPLGQTEHRDPRETCVRKHARRTAELRLPAVDEDEVGNHPEAEVRVLARLDPVMAVGALLAAIGAGRVAHRDVVAGAGQLQAAESAPQRLLQ